MSQDGRRPRLCASSALNTAPLLWGFLHGEGREQVDLSFATPATSAERAIAGAVDVSLAPAVEIARHGLQAVPGVGVACHGAVRSILLVARKPWSEIRTLAADESSRTSVELARIVLARRYGAEPAVSKAAPNVESMLLDSDAGLLIGDAALAVDTQTLKYPHLDLGEAWLELTGLPFVFARWAGRPGAPGLDRPQLYEDSCDEGLCDLERIVEEEAARRELPHVFVHHYLTRNIKYHIGAEELNGLERYLRYVQELGALATVAQRIAC
jgi:predicted solute-binding protein